MIAPPSTWCVRSSPANNGDGTIQTWTPCWSSSLRNWCRCPLGSLAASHQSVFDQKRGDSSSIIILLLGFSGPPRKHRKGLDNTCDVEGAPNNQHPTWDPVGTERRGRPPRTCCTSQGQGMTCSARTGIYRTPCRQLPSTKCRWTATCDESPRRRRIRLLSDGTWAGTRPTLPFHLRIPVTSPFMRAKRNLHDYCQCRASPS